VFVTDRGVVKVGDFGTSRFLELAAHGTTVIGSPPYMAPEQIEGRAVFASDIYSLGVSMYQMLTGELPYGIPSPSDLERLRRGELTPPARLKNPQIPIAIDDIVMRALAGPVSERYQRCEDFLQDLLRVRREVIRRPAAPAPPSPTVQTPPAAASPPATVPGEGGPPATAPAPRPARPARRTPAVRTRDVAPNRFCWQCRKPLPARSSRCPFCGESQ
jgi:serine/threonine-protein kinase